MTVATTLAHGTFGPPGLCSGDAPTAKSFYTSLLGWEANDVNMEGGSYTMFKSGGEFVAGMYQMPDNRKQAGVRPHWNAYLAVDDIQDIVRKAQVLGGKVLNQPFDAEGDLMANLEDPLGAKFSVWQSRKSNPDASRINEIGALCWTELYTTDPARAEKFYTELIGWKAAPFEHSPMPYTVFTPPGAEMGIGGMLKITGEMQGMTPQWVPYFMVQDADKIAAQATKLGANVHPPFDIPTVGRISIGHDKEGATFAFIKVMDMK